MTKPVLLVTRQLPEAVADRAQREFDVRLNQPDLQWAPDEIVALAQGCDAILCFSTDRLLAPTIAALPASVKAIATCSVGYDHVDVAAARGSLVDDAALQEALRSGQVAFAGLDVYDGEPNLHQGYFGLENVVLLPHMGSSTTETRAAMGDLCLDAIGTVLAGNEPWNLIR